MALLVLQGRRTAFHRRPQQRGIEKRRTHGGATRKSVGGIAQSRLDELQQLRRFRDHGFALREHFAKQSEFTQGAKARRGIDRQQYLQHFLEQPRCRNLAQQRRQLRNCLARRGFDLETQLRGDTHRAQHAHRILAIAQLGVADQAQLTPFQVLQPANIIDDRKIANIVVEPVDGEVAAKSIFLQRSIDVVRKNPTTVVAFVGITDRATKRGHFENFATEANVGDQKTTPHQATTAEQSANLLGLGIGRDVEILWRHASQQIAHAATDHVGLVAGVLERIENLQRGAGNLRTRNRMFRARNTYGVYDGGNP